VTVKGVTETEPVNTSIVFDEPNGSYHYKVGGVSGFGVAGSPKTASVNGGPASVVVTFTAKTPAAPAPTLFFLGLFAGIPALSAGVRRMRPRGRAELA
jgi:hypothetical protein